MAADGVDLLVGAAALLELGMEARAGFRRRFVARIARGCRTRRDRPRRCRRIRHGANAVRRSRPLRDQHADHGVPVDDRPMKAIGAPPDGA